jgi:carbonic anhydrase
LCTSTGAAKNIDGLLIAHVTRYISTTPIPDFALFFLFSSHRDTRHMQPGWPTNWEQFNDFIPYDNMTNQCMDCSADPAVPGNKVKCRKAVQSPIDLKRNITARRQCRDRHRMNYVKGDCRFDTLDFEILPHVLRVYQPSHEQKCNVTPTIDFSMGFPYPWLLEFSDISVPSQHTQDGYRYDAEVVLSHTSSSNGKDRYIGNVAVFLEMGTENDHYDFLELYIREWIQSHVSTRTACKGRLDSEDEVDWWNEDFDNDDGKVAKKKWDWLLKESAEATKDKSGVHDPKAGRDLRRGPIRVSTGEEVINKEWYQGPWHPYDWVRESKTQYYFRYFGSLLEPPCFKGVHWRVMRRPITISPRQLDLLHKLLFFRLNPDTCKRDTAGKTSPVGMNGTKVDVNRPLQQLYTAHGLVYCECVDWNSTKKADKDYCKGTMEERGVTEYTHMYRPVSSPTRAPSL